MVLAYQRNRAQRGWSLAWVGTLIMFLTLMLPALAGQQIIANAETLLEEGMRISNPRILTSGAIALGLLGGYIVMFGGLIDLKEEGASPVSRAVPAVASLLIIVLLIVGGGVDTYSVMVEFYSRGETLGLRFVEHFAFVLVSLLAGSFVGIGLGLWASRDERVEPVILYAVGIIQTVPSLALFGVLLVPLARLGDQLFSSVLVFFVGTLILGVVVFLVLGELNKRVPPQLQNIFLIVAILFLVVPISLFMVIFITFSFNVTLDVLLDPGFSQLLPLIIVALLSLLGFTWYIQRISDEGQKRRLRRVRLVIAVVVALVLVGFFVMMTGRLLANEELAELTIRDLGVSGIGTAPAIIALTLYSLLPLVRNTYAGLNNVDVAIIDSGRGMGMTPAQIFFQIELPLAFPIIMAGVRNAGISLVGIAAVASIIGAGALGDFILLGVNSTSIDLILLGAIPAVILAILLDVLLVVLEALLTSPGIRNTAN